MTGTWQSGIRTLRTEAVGIVRLLVIDPCDDAEVLFAADMGDEFALAAMQAASKLLHLLEIPPRDRTPQGSPIPCLICWRHVTQIEHGILCAIAVPVVARPGDAYSEIICRSCAQHTDLMNRSVVGFGSMWPDIRPADMSALVGHA